MALVAVVFGPGPARADAADAARHVAVVFDQHQVAMGTQPPGAVLVYRLKVTGGPAHDVHLTVDLSGVAGFAVPAPSEHCAGSLCTVDVASTTTDFYTLTVLPKPGAAAGASGTVTVSGTASDAAVTGDSLTLTNGRPELGVSESADMLHQAPGDTLTFPLRVWNRGILPAAKGVELRIDTTAGLRVLGSWANCRDVPVSKGLQAAMAHQTVCDFPAPVEAGKQYALSSPLRVAVGGDAFRDMITYAFTPLTGVATTNGSGTALTLLPDGSAPSTENGDADYFTTYVDTDNHADFAVTGDTVTGRRGGHATLRATVTNRGPALVEDLDDSEAALWVSVKLPSGTKATKIPHSCYPSPNDGTAPAGTVLGLSAYVCYVSDHPAPGQSFALSFTVAIGPRTPAVASGRISTQRIYQGLDPVASNNSAALTVRLAPGGPGGAGSGSGSGGAPAASGTLADTGFAGSIAWLAGALMLAGGALLATIRRTRRARGTG
jgi:hypothetical protein